MDHDSVAVGFEGESGADPPISANLARDPGTDTAFLRLGDIVDDGPSASAECVARDETSADAEVWHEAEDMGGIAFDQGGLLQAVAVDDVARRPSRLRGGRPARRPDAGGLCALRRFVVCRIPQADRRRRRPADRTKRRRTWTAATSRRNSPISAAWWRI